MKRYLNRVFAVILIGVSMNSNAQDIHFSQFYENAMLRNPALTGIFTGDYKVGLDYRSQWGNVASPYNTVMLSGETRILVNREINDYLSFGLVTSFDKAGSVDFNSTQIYPAISYNKALEDVYHTYLSVGLSGGYFTRSVNQAKMTTTNQYINGTFDPANPTGENAVFRNMNGYDVGAGVSLNSSLDQNGAFNYYLGVSAFHINTPTQVFTGADPISIPMKWQFNGGFHSSFSEQFGVTVHGNYSFQQPSNEFILGGFFTWRSVPVGLPSIFALNFGLFYRNNDAFIPMIRVDYKDVSVGFSQDVTNSSLSANTSGAGATELTFYVRGNYQHKKNSRDPLFCPRFEDLNSYNFR
ncbi:MAG: PorP/SprF family type IX secretion system membrane protein [Taibaiella sp.]|nr:PorP/SprF family type IX secretion system membrane protein [Taibaiella sp.]